jgi:hypothetical protein
MPDTEPIVAAIDRRLAEAAAEIDALTTARNALAPTTPTVRRPATSAAQRRSPTKVHPKATPATALGGAPAARQPASQPRRPSAAAASKPRERRARPGARKGTPVSAAALEAVLTSADGLSTAAVATHAGAHPAQVLPGLRELEADGKARRTGSTRATRWHWITDEDRVAARTAELEALTTPGSRARAPRARRGRAA